MAKHCCREPSITNYDNVLCFLRVQVIIIHRNRAYLRWGIGVQSLFSQMIQMYLQDLFSLLSFVIASTGLVAILPSQTGYGESLLIPSILDKMSKTTAALPLYSKAKSIVSMMSNGKTVVGDEAYFMG